MVQDNNTVHRARFVRPPVYRSKQAWDCDAIQQQYAPRRIR